MPTATAQPKAPKVVARKPRRPRPTTTATTSTDSTPDPQAGTSMTERLVAALSASWRAIQDRHPDVPDVVLTIGSGTLGARRGEVRYGHFAAGRWHATTPAVEDRNQGDDGDQDDQGDGDGRAEPSPAPGMAELFIGGEGLRRGAPDVLGTLLHEAAHGVAATRTVNDTSRQGRYHNKKFAELAQELGISVEHDRTRGWSATTVPAETLAAYPAVLAALAAAITAYRSAESTGEGKTKSRNSPTALCGCSEPRRIRVSRAVLAAGPIVCSLCDGPFEPDEPDEETGDGETDDDH